MPNTAASGKLQTSASSSVSSSSSPSIPFHGLDIASIRKTFIRGSYLTEDNKLCDFYESLDDIKQRFHQLPALHRYILTKTDQTKIPRYLSSHDPHIQDEYGHTALELATAFCEVEWFKYLLTIEGMISSDLKSLFKPLEIAIAGNYVDIVKLYLPILFSHLVLTHPSMIKEFLQHLIFEVGCVYGSVEALIELTDFLNKQYRGLYFNFKYENIDNDHFHVNPNLKTSFGFTPLQFAAYVNCPKAVKFLDRLHGLQRALPPPNLDMSHDEELSPLQLAVKYDCKESFDELLSLGFFGNRAYNSAYNDITFEAIKPFPEYHKKLERRTTIDNLALGITIVLVGPFILLHQVGESASSLIRSAVSNKTRNKTNVNPPTESTTNSTQHINHTLTSVRLEGQALMGVRPHAIPEELEQVIVPAVTEIVREQFQREQNRPEASPGTSNVHFTININQLNITQYNAVAVGENNIALSGSEARTIVSNRIFSL